MTSHDQENCVGTTSTEPKPTIDELNDRLRCHWVGGRIGWTNGVAQLGIDAMMTIFHAIEEFDSFTPDNDPYGEHDFGSIDLLGKRFFWKIEYYDQSLENGSLDPADPSVTTRVLTIMLASEY